MQLLIGCGHSREKRMAIGQQTWTDLVTVDQYAECKPDCVHNLNVTPWPFQTNSASEIHAYEVLEHLGKQGDAKSFFAHFTEIWRILKPDGYLFATVPSSSSKWAWGDPSHTRLIQPESLIFLQQAQYRIQCDGTGGQKTAMSDFRHMYQADFRVLHSVDNGQTFSFVLQAIK